jgi:hypothetical protein
MMTTMPATRTTARITNIRTIDNAFAPKSSATSASTVGVLRYVDPDDQGRRGHCDKARDDQVVESVAHAER